MIAPWTRFGREREGRCARALLQHADRHGDDCAARTEHERARIRAPRPDRDRAGFPGDVLDGRVES